MSRASSASEMADSLQDFDLLGKRAPQLLVGLAHSCLLAQPGRAPGFRSRARACSRARPFARGGPHAFRRGVLARAGRGAPCRPRSRGPRGARGPPPSPPGRPAGGWSPPLGWRWRRSVRRARAVWARKRAIKSALASPPTMPTISPPNTPRPNAPTPRPTFLRPEFSRHPVLKAETGDELACLWGEDESPIMPRQRAFARPFPQENARRMGIKSAPTPSRSQTNSPQAGPFGKPFRKRAWERADRHAVVARPPDSSLQRRAGPPQSGEKRRPALFTDRGLTAVNLADR